MWQDYFAQHGYLEQTAGWQLALEGLLGEALTPVAFPEKASWKAMTKDGLPLLQHTDLQDRITAAAAEAFPRVISRLLTSEALVMPDVMRQALCGMEHLKGAQNVFAALCRQMMQASVRLQKRMQSLRRACASLAGLSSEHLCRKRQRCIFMGSTRLEAQLLSGLRQATCLGCPAQGAAGPRALPRL